MHAELATLARMLNRLRHNYTHWLPPPLIVMDAMLASNDNISLADRAGLSLFGCGPGTQTASPVSVVIPR
jgi:hypothetical protein